MAGQAPRGRLGLAQPKDARHSLADVSGQGLVGLRVLVLNDPRAVFILEDVVFRARCHASMAARGGARPRPRVFSRAIVRTSARLRGAREWKKSAQQKGRSRQQKQVRGLGFERGDHVAFGTPTLPQISAAAIRELIPPDTIRHPFPNAVGVADASPARRAGKPGHRRAQRRRCDTI